MMRADHVDPQELERNLRRMARKLSGDDADASACYGD